MEIKITIEGIRIEASADNVIDLVEGVSDVLVSIGRAAEDAADRLSDRWERQPSGVSTANGQDQERA